MGFSICRIVQPSPPSNSKTFPPPSTAKKVPYPWSNQSFSTNPPPRQPRLSLWICLFQVFRVNGILQYVAFCIFFSPSTMFSRFIHVAADISSSFLFMAEWHSILWIDHILFVHQLFIIWISSFWTFFFPFGLHREETFRKVTCLDLKLYCESPDIDVSCLHMT